MRRALSRSEGGAAGIPAARCRKLDHMRQCVAARLAEHLPATGTGVKHQADDLFQTPLDQAQIDFENEGGETYICGNPPYHGTAMARAKQQKLEHETIFSALYQAIGNRLTTWRVGHEGR